MKPLSIDKYLFDDRTPDDKEFELLLKAGADPNAIGCGHYGEDVTALTDQRTVKRIQLLLNYGADINGANEYETTALHSALKERDNLEIVEFLLKSGAKLEGDELLILAANGRIEYIVQLLDAGIDIDAVTEYGHTALMLSIGGEGLPYDDVFELLLEKGANPNIQNEHGETALHWATKNDNTYAVEMLLKYGADKTIKDNNGKTALDIARAYDYEEIVDLLNRTTSKIGLRPK